MEEVTVMDGLDENELAQALVDALAVAPEKGVTTRYLAKVTGLSQTTVKVRLRGLKETGRLGVGSVVTEGLDGRRSKSPTYYLKDKK